ncbi:MAG: beta-ribofuranosylaminobenzene 5'-phosphate synthase family protein [Candidatus Bathyarchaeia archaeon]
MKVYVKTSARLHMGLLDLGGELGRIFGGIGLAINSPNVILQAKPSKSLTIVGEKSDFVKLLVKRFSEAYHIKTKVNVNVKQTIPEHVGLGSGTQLALAVATALAKLFQIKVSIRDLARLMGRGQISGVGTAVFEHGGFVVEGGFKAQNGKPSLSIPESFPPVIFRHQFPEDWLFVVAIPDVKRGFTDEEEVPAFKRLPPMTARDVGKICRLTIMKLLPSLMEQDIENFGTALTQIQNIVGEYFAEAQGGKYSSPIAKECAEQMQKIGVYGVGQSSWGPTFYGLVKGEKQAKRLQSNVQALLNKKISGKTFIAKASNRGAYIKLTKD